MHEAIGPVIVYVQYLASMLLVASVSLKRVWLRALQYWYALQRSSIRQETNVGTGHVVLVLVTNKLEQEVHWEANLERNSGINVINLFLAQLDCQRLDVALKMVDLPAANDWVHEGVLVAYIGQGDAGDLCLLLVGDGFELLGDFDVLLGSWASVTTLLVVLALLFGGEVAATKGTPRAQSHAFFACHRDDLTLEVTIGCGPAALVDTEATEAVVAGI